MRKRPLAVFGALTLVASLASAVPGQDVENEPIVTPAIDEGALAKATDNGQTLLHGAKWITEIKLDVSELIVAGPALVCRGSVVRDAAAARRAGFGAGFSPWKSVVLDTQSGRTFWETNTELRPPMAWLDDGLFGFEGRNGQLKLQRSSADNPAGATIWEASYTPPPEQRGTTQAVPTFVDQQIIVGESWQVQGGRGGGGGSTTRTSLSIRSIDRKTGELRWKTALPGKWASAQVGGVQEGKVYVSASELGMRGKGMIMGLTAADGKVLWKNDLEVSLNRAVASGTDLYTLARNSVVSAYNGATGNEIWHTAISKDCDPEKSKLGNMRFLGALALERDRLLVAVVTESKPIGAPAGGDKTAEGIAVLDLKSGKQLGFYNDKGVTTKTGNPIDELQVHGDEWIAERRGLGCLGIDRKTLKLQWFIPASFTAIAGDVLYVNPDSTRYAPTTIMAVPLDIAR